VGKAMKPLPSALMTWRTPFLVNAIFFPSGDQVGPSSNV